MFKWLLCLCLCAHLSLDVHAQKNTYSAKVVDYAPTYDNTPEEILKVNTLKVVQELEKYSRDDIVVFPEYAITGINLFSSSDLSEYAIPIPDADLIKNWCRNEEAHQIIQDVACAMTQSNAPYYLVLNLLEKKNKDIYNTNVVFKRNSGSIVAKYRKINLNEEYEKGRLTAGSEVVTFDANELGVTFGLLTSDDIFHKTPAQDIFKEAKVTDAIITSAWRSELPFYSAVGLHSGYSKKNGINVLAASLSDPETGRGGSGIYGFGAPNIVYIPSVPGIQTKTADVQVLKAREPFKACSKLIQPRGIGALPSIDSFKTRVIKNVNDFTMKPLLKTENDYSLTEEICKGKLCCKFVINYGADIFNINPVYKVAVSNTACGLIACDSDDSTKCGSRHEELAHAMFNNITITVKASGKNNFQYQPVASTNKLVNIDYTFCDNTDEIIMAAVSQSAVSYMGVIMGGVNGGQSLAGFSFLGLISIIIALRNLM